MIGVLPRTLEVNGVDYPIRSDYRVALLIFQVLNSDFTQYEKLRIYLESLYIEVPSDIEKALEKANWFLDGGDTPKSKKLPKKTFDWVQDEYLIFPAINKVAGCETRNSEYIHWWTFLGYFNEMGEGLFSQVINIRSKKNKHKKLEKWEEDFYKEHREIIDLKKRLTPEELAEKERINKLLS